MTILSEYREQVNLALQKEECKIKEAKHTIQRAKNNLINLKNELQQKKLEIARQYSNVFGYQSH